MSNRFAQGTYQPKNPQKYVGNSLPKYRSSWESHFFRQLDEHPAVLQWGSEVVRIPYRHPLTGKIHTYIPDILMMYVDASYKKHVEIIEIKPNSQTSLTEARSQHDKIHAIINEAKWTAAREYCRKQGIVFRVVSEKDLFHQGTRTATKRTRKNGRK